MSFLQPWYEYPIFRFCTYVFPVVILVFLMYTHKGVVLNRHDGELRTARYWAEMMSGLQQESIPLKGPLSVTDYHAIVESITTKDLQLCLECLGLDDKQLYTAIGKTVQPAGVFPEKEQLVKASPMAGMTRGGPLFN